MSGVLVVHVVRDETDSNAIVRLPDEFNNTDEWIEKHGPKWADAHYRMVDSYVAVNYGWEWNIGYLNWFETEQEYLDEFVNDSFLEETGNE